MHMELRELEAFVTISRVGGFTHAAALLHVSQPAISRRMDLLERELGAPLFERIPGGVRLSEAGQAFLPYAQRVLAAIQDGTAAVRALEEDAEGAITLALVGTLASTALTARLRAFRDAHPRVHLLLRTARSDEVSALVRQGEARVGLRYFADADSVIESRLVMEEPLLAICAARSRFFAEPPTEPAALRGVPWVGFPSGAGSSSELFARTLEQQLLRHDLDASERIIIDSLSAQKRLIEADFGVGLVPASSVTEELQLGTVRVLPVPALRTVVPVMAITRRHAYLSRATRLLLTTLTQTLPPQ
jgi:DNA-binding transcriptional LysR family regulator